MKEKTTQRSAPLGHSAQDWSDPPPPVATSRWSRLLRSVPAAAFVAAAVLAADYLTGPFIQFPILFIAPVAMAAWFHGLRWGIGFAVLLPLAHMAVSLLHHVPWSLLDVGINALIRLGFGSLCLPDGSSSTA